MQERSAADSKFKSKGSPETQESRTLETSDGRTLTLTLVATGVEPTPFGKNLKYTFALTAVSSVSDMTLTELGFDVLRLRSLELAPREVSLARLTCTRECTSEQASKVQKALMNQFERWIQQREASGEFKEKIKLDTKDHVRRGPESRFRL